MAEILFSQEYERREYDPPMPVLARYASQAYAPSHFRLEIPLFPAATCSTNWTSLSSEPQA